MNLPVGTYGRICSRSGGLRRQTIGVLQGVLDEDYTGVVSVFVLNLSDRPWLVKPGDKIGQLVIESYVKADIVEVVSDELWKSERGDRGFGSTDCWYNDFHLLK